MACRLWDTISGETLLVMEGHTNWVRSVAFSPCGKQIASASEDSTIRLWSSETGECLFVLSGHKWYVLSVAYSADGRRLVSGGMDGTIRAWDPQAGAPEAETGLILNGEAGEATVIAFSPISELIVLSSIDKTVRLWDSSSGQLISRLSGHNKRITTCAFFPDGLQIASGDVDGIVRLWEVNTNRPSSIIQELTGEVRTVAYSHDGLSIFSYHDDKAIQQWNSSTGSSRSIPLPSALDVYSFALSPNGHWFACGCRDGNIRLKNVQTDIYERFLLRGSFTAVTSMRFSHCGRWFASFDSDGVTWLWDLDSTDNHGEAVGEKFRLRGPRGFVVFPLVGDQIAVGLVSDIYCSSRIRLFDPRVTDFRQPLKELWILDRLHSMDYSPDGQRLILGTDASSVMLWNLQSDKPDVELKGHIGAVYSVAYSPCGKWILSGGKDNTARLWSGEIDSWSFVTVISGCLEAVTCVAWNPVVPMEFVTGSDDGSVRVWRISGAEAGNVSVRMHWSSHSGRLCAVDLAFEGVVGLSPINRKLLVQRSAAGRSFFFEENESLSSEECHETGTCSSDFALMPEL
ncbi:WD40 repeat-like protein [Linnemannia elongata AG-77]|uniref:WD40 repeat-like protein n=1 Tax=Linnemannia elongata AG-77 TaxID=1314771 RepID=A0A197K5E6_9FUNG|nr:WD40 repeat-like protein [Linnemannia elongata AG-77]